MEKFPMQLLTGPRQVLLAYYNLPSRDSGYFTIWQLASDL